MLSFCLPGCVPCSPISRSSFSLVVLRVCGYFSLDLTIITNPSRGWCALSSVLTVRARGLSSVRFSFVSVFSTLSTAFLSGFILLLSSLVSFFPSSVLSVSCCLSCLVLALLLLFSRFALAFVVFAYPSSFRARRLLVRCFRAFSPFALSLPSSLLVCRCSPLLFYCVGSVSFAISAFAFFFRLLLFASSPFHLCIRASLLSRSYSLAPQFSGRSWSSASFIVVAFSGCRLYACVSLLSRLALVSFSSSFLAAPSPLLLSVCLAFDSCSFQLLFLVFASSPLASFCFFLFFFFFCFVFFFFLFFFFFFFCSASSSPARGVERWQ